MRQLGLAACLVLTSSVTFSANEAISEHSLPLAIHSQLDQEYPGWKIAPASKEVQAEFRKHHINRDPSLMTGEFDQDGEQDYVIQITRTQPEQEEQSVLVFLKRGEGFEEVPLESRAINPSVYLWKMKNRPTNTPDAPRPPKERIMVLGGELGQSTYEFDNGKFRDVGPAIGSRGDSPGEDY